MHVSILPHSDGTFLCRPCFRNAEKLLQMRWDGCKLEDKLAELLKQLGEQQGLSLNVSGELKTPPPHAHAPTASELRCGNSVGSEGARPF